MKLGKLSQRLNRSLGVAPVDEEDTFADALSDFKDAETRATMKGRIARWLGDTDHAANTSEAISLKDACGGYYVDTPYGQALVVDTYFPVTSNHGDRRVGALFDWPSAAFGELESLTADSRLAGFDPRRTIFVDIEASGLRHGAGTYAFLVGLGFIEGDNVVIRQVLLEDQGCEQALLHVVADHLDRFDYLSSFNGKSYDLTVLISRLVMHHFFSQRDCDLKLRPHLDLLHLSKNLFKLCWDNTKLQTLEREALGFERVDDVPGSLVPSCWYHFLRTAQPGPVVEVAKHNLYDVLSMVTLADRLVSEVACTIAAAAYPEVRLPGEGRLQQVAELNSSSASQPTLGRWPVDSRPRGSEYPAVQVNMGGLLLRRGRPEEALICLRRGLETLDPRHPSMETALRHAVTAARRAGERVAQGALIDRWCDHFPASSEAWTALSIHEERVRKALNLALVAAYRAQAISSSASNQKRVARLRQRLERLRGKGVPVMERSA